MLTLFTPIEPRVAFESFPEVITAKIKDVENPFYLSDSFASTLATTDGSGQI